MLINNVRQVISDFKGLKIVCGITVALNWLLMIILNLNECIKTRNFQPADIALGEGPFKVHRGDAKAVLKGTQSHERY